MSRRFLPAFVLAILLGPAAVLAQGPRGGGFAGSIGFQWWDSPLANGLNLSESQNKQIHSIVAEYRTRLIDLRANEQKAQGDFEDVFNDAPADQKRANDAIDRLSNARAGDDQGDLANVVADAQRTDGRAMGAVAGAPGRADAESEVASCGFQGRSSDGWPQRVPERAGRWEFRYAAPA